MTISRLEFPRDTKLRHRYLPYSDHGAKMPLTLVEHLVSEYTVPADLILDPMAGTGSTAYAATSDRDVILVELETHYARMCAQNALHLKTLCDAPGIIDVIQADATSLPLVSDLVDCIILSPPYDDLAKRQRWKEPNVQRRTNVPEWALKRTDASFHVDSYGKHPKQVGNYREEKYDALMRDIYGECYRVMFPGGILIVVTADYWRNHERVNLRGRTWSSITAAGFDFVEHWHRDRSRTLSMPQRLRQKQGLPTIDEEDIQVFRKPNEF